MTDVWPDDKILRLRTLWDEGHSTSVIADMLGISKNAAVGKAHRLNLPARPSPIKPAGSGNPAPPPRLPPPKLETLMALPPPVAEMPRTPVLRSSRSCQFPMWPHGTRPGLSPRYCGNQVRRRPDGKHCVYCSTHAAKAYTLWERAA